MSGFRVGIDGEGLGWGQRVLENNGTLAYGYEPLHRETSEVIGYSLIRYIGYCCGRLCTKELFLVEVSGSMTL